MGIARGDRLCTGVDTVVVLVIRVGCVLPQTDNETSKKVHEGGCLNEGISVGCDSVRFSDSGWLGAVQCAAQCWCPVGGVMFDNWFMRRLAVGMAIAVLMFAVRYVMYGVGF